MTNWVRVVFLGLVLAIIGTFSFEQVIQSCPFISNNLLQDVNRSITVSYHFEDQFDLLDASFTHLHLNKYSQNNHKCPLSQLATLARSRLVVDNVYIIPCDDLRNTAELKLIYGGSVWHPSSGSLHRFTPLFRNKRILFIGDSVMSGYYRTYKHMLIHVCGSDIIHHNGVLYLWGNRQDESVHCPRLNASATFVRNHFFGNLSLDKFEDANLSTHILLENFVWFFYVNKTENETRIPPKLPSFIRYLHNTILLCKSIAKLAKISILGTPGIAGINNLGFMGNTSYKYIVIESNYQFHAYARSRGFQFINLRTLMEEQFEYVKGSIESNWSIRQMFVDNYHPCVPWTDIPALTIFLLSNNL